MTARLLLVSVLTTAVAAGVASGAPSPASRIVDRTVLCRTYGAGYPDPVRELSVQAVPRLGSSSPNAGVLNGPDGTPRAVVANVKTGPDFGEGAGAVVMSRFTCGRTSLQIPVSSKGLRGGSTPLGDRYTCEVPATILIRLRAEFRNPVSLHPSDDSRHLNVAEGRIRTASIAVTTKTAAAIAFATVGDATGKASIFVAPSRCRSAD